MDNMKWNEKLKTVVAILDKQHKEYLSLCEKAYKTAKSKSAGLSAALKAANKAAAQHFKTEEEMMGMVFYPEMQGHKNLHDKFIKMEEAIAKEALSAADSQKLADKIKEELFDWFVLHIEKNDFKLTKILKLNNIK